GCRRRRRGARRAGAGCHPPRFRRGAVSEPGGPAASEFRVVPLDPADAAAVERAAVLLVEGFREHHPRAWPDMDAARAEVSECLNPEWVILGAFDADGALVGWIGGQPHYY